MFAMYVVPFIAMDEQTSNEEGRAPNSVRTIDDFFFGAVRLGERGQVSLPAEARKRAGIEPGDRLLVFLHPWGAGILLMKVDQVNVWSDHVRRMLDLAESLDLHLVDTEDDS